MYGCWVIMNLNTKNWVPQVENVGEGGLITAKAYYTNQDQTNCEISMS